ncbi:MAG: hypothetical protein AB1486_04170 [Planctomycetota bacterium]
MPTLALAWVLRSLAIRSLGGMLGMAPGDIDALELFRDELVGELTELASPEA